MDTRRQGTFRSTARRRASAIAVAGLTLAAVACTRSTDTTAPASPTSRPPTTTAAEGADRNDDAEAPDDGGGGASSDDGTTTSRRATTTRPAGDLPAGVEPLDDGPIALVTLGDSLTEGDGDDAELGGYPGRLAAALRDRGEDVELTNLGHSGWDSTQLVEGQEGAPERPQLADALEAVDDATAAGRQPLVLLLIGSNDLWYLYGNEADTTSGEEQENLDHYRANLDRVVGDLRDAGATVVLAINDDQTRRPVARDPAIRRDAFPDITDDEVARMSAQARRYADVVRDVAADRGALVVDFLEAPFFADPAMLADDGNHPNAAGYDEMAAIWLSALAPLLDR